MRFIGDCLEVECTKIIIEDKEDGCEFTLTGKNKMQFASQILGTKKFRPIGISSTHKEYIIYIAGALTVKVVK